MRQRRASRQSAIFRDLYRVSSHSLTLLTGFVGFACSRSTTPPLQPPSTLEPGLPTHQPTTFRHQHLPVGCLPTHLWVTTDRNDRISLSPHHDPELLCFFLASRAPYVIVASANCLSLLPLWIGLPSVAARFIHPSPRLLIIRLAVISSSLRCGDLTRHTPGIFLHLAMP